MSNYLLQGIELREKVGENIFFLFPSRILGGHELMTIEIIKDHLKSGGSCTVGLSYDNKELFNLLNNLKLKMINLPFTSPRLEVLHAFLNFNLVKRASVFLNEINKKFGSIIIAQGDIEIGSIYLKAAMVNNIRIISYIPYAHSSVKLNKKFAMIRDFFSVKVYKLQKEYITIYDNCVEDIKKYNTNAKVFVIKNKVRDLSSYSQLRSDYYFSKKDNIFRIYLIGRVYFYQKGHDRLLKVLKNIDNACLKNVEIGIIGDGPDLKKLEILFSSLENIDVKFYGWMKEPWEEAYKADLILIPSRFEGVPLIMLEAINLNINLLASRVDGMINYLDDDKLFSNEIEFKDKLELCLMR